MAIRAAPLPFDPAVRALSSSVGIRRAALWGLLVSKLLGGWGVQWDIQWHVLIGRDSFWIAPHLMTYAGVGLSVLLSWGVLAWESLLARPRPDRRRRRHDPAPRPDGHARAFTSRRGASR